MPTWWWTRPDGARAPRCGWRISLRTPGRGEGARRPRLRHPHLPSPGAGLGDDRGIVIGPTPDSPRGGALQLLEGNRFLVTLMGMLGDYPPTDPDGFLDFATSLRIPDLAEVIRDAEPLAQARSFRFPASVRRRYERLSRFPAGFLVTGDGLCSFNPIYAQGMTVAALEARTLHRHLQRGTEPHARCFFRDVAKVIDVPWAMSVGGDLAFPEVTGHRSPKMRIGNVHPAPARSRRARSRARYCLHPRRRPGRSSGAADEPRDPAARPASECLAPRPNRAP